MIIGFQVETGRSVPYTGGTFFNSGWNVLNNLSQIIKNDSRFRLLSQENKGYACALNIALQHASGEYITIHDDDDRALPKEIEKQFTSRVIKV